jgi:hypothetical protein
VSDAVAAVRRKITLGYVAVKRHPICRSARRVKNAPVCSCKFRAFSRIYFNGTRSRIRLPKILKTLGDSMSFFRFRVLGGHHLRKVVARAAAMTS